jgi:hypothetical protein
VLATRSWQIRCAGGCDSPAAAGRQRTTRVELGAPWENGYAESFQSRLRDELLNVEEFTTLAKARTLAEEAS